jgi:hypothetical protein
MKIVSNSSPFNRIGKNRDVGYKAVIRGANEKED